MVDVLLQLGASPDIPDNTSITCLMVAAKNGAINLVRKFIQQNINHVDETGDTALLFAVEGGHNVIAEELCKNHADVNVHVGDKCVLRKALEKGSEELANKLIFDFEYNIHWRDSFGHTTIEWAHHLGKTCLL